MRCQVETCRKLVGIPADQLITSISIYGAECSGGGGLLPITMPETADAIADHRLTEVKESQVNRIVTSCATCKNRLSRDGVEAVDLIEALEAATR